MSSTGNLQVLSAQEKLFKQRSLLPQPMTVDEIHQFVAQYRALITDDAQIAQNILQESIKKYDHDIEMYKKIVMNFKTDTPLASSTRSENEQKIGLLEEKRAILARTYGSLITVLDRELGDEYPFSFIEFLLRDRFIRFAIMPAGDFWHSYATILGWTRCIAIRHAPKTRCCDNEQYAHILGHFSIYIPLDPQQSLQEYPSNLPVKIMNVSSIGSCASPHPHIGDGGNPCLGDFRLLVDILAQQKRYMQIFPLLFLFLSTYSMNMRDTQRRPYNGAELDKWPVMNIEEINP